jgi:hypothetical protein
MYYMVMNAMEICSATTSSQKQNPRLRLASLYPRKYLDLFNLFIKYLINF